MRKINTICCLFCLCLFASCNNWLDLKPYGEVEQDKMFEDEEGFIQTLSGSYLLLTDPSAYGKELMIGFPDEIVHYWKKQSEFYKFDYKNAEVVSRLDATWLQMYKAIANTNLVLQNLEGRDPADFDHYNLIKGEALGLRAYIHLELLGLFGPVLKETGMDEKAIPYHEEFSNQTVRLMTAAEVMSRIQRDLDSAYILLADDPIKVYGRDEYKDLGYGDLMAPEVKGLAFSYRGCRLNYYAVCAVLARFHMLKGEEEKALQYANEVLVDGADIFRLATRDDVAGDDDTMFERELIWSLFDSETQKHLIDNIKTSTIDEANKDFMYKDTRSHGSAEDYRYRYWFEYSKTTPAFWYLSKYNRTYSSIDKLDETAWRTVVPMIRLSEMYYIAAEASLQTNPAEAYRLLNLVRKARNLQTALPSNMENDALKLKEQILYEYQKEFWGEGRLFHFYKRLFLDIDTREEHFAASRQIYELPLPQDELEFGDNNH